MNAREWLSDLKRVPVLEVATHLGLEVMRRDTFGPCPKCGQHHRSSQERRPRGALGLDPSRLGWHCWRCDAKGSSVDLIGAVMGCKGTDPEVRRWGADRGWCAALHGETGGPRVKPKRQAKAQAKKPKGPTLEEVRALWSATIPITDDPMVVDWAAGRGLDPDWIDDLGLVRALPRSGRLPRWAQSWRDDYRVIVPLFDAAGELAMVRARRVTPGKPKGLAPRDSEIGGLVLGADRTAQPGGTVWIVEGVPDWLTLASWLSETSPDVVWGIGSGAWSQAHADRIPSGTTVRILSHWNPDKGHYDYLAMIVATLDHCEVWAPGDGYDRWSDDGEKPQWLDINDRWQTDGREIFDPTHGLEIIGQEEEAADILDRPIEPIEPSAPNSTNVPDADDPGSTEAPKTSRKAPNTRPPLLLRTKPSTYMVLEQERDQYTPMSGREARAALHHRWGVDITFENDDGRTVPIPVETLFEQQGYQLTEEIVTFESHRVGLDWQQTHSKRGVIRRALPHHYMDIAPIYDKRADEFIDLIGGEDATRLRHVIAHFGDLSVSLPAIIARGHKGCGKSLLADMLARLFNRDYTLTFEALFRGDHWNEGALQTPVVIGDELTLRVNELDLVKAAIGPGRLDVRQRWQDTRTLHVHQRFIFMQNRKPLFKTHKDSASSIEALLERMIVLRPDESEARKFFKRHNADKSLTNRWYRGEPGRPYGALCHHLRWMQEPERRPPSQGRFTVEADERANREILLETGGMNESVLSYAAAHLLGEAIPDPNIGYDRPIYYFNKQNPRRNSHIIMNQSGVLQHWRATTGQYAQPAPESVKAALEQLAEEGKARHRTDLPSPHNRVPKGGWAVPVKKILRAAGLDETLSVTDVLRMRQQKEQQAQGNQ